MNLEILEEKCWGCKTCEVACQQENQTQAGVKLLQVWEDGPRQEDGHWHFVFRVSRCRHCAEPPCAAVCAAGAIVKRDDGIVVLDRGVCSGCLLCREACPYGAIAFDGEANVAAKCNLCLHRLDQGLLPACADNVCLAHCIHLTGS